jgi:hypothetical protein
MVAMEAAMQQLLRVAVRLELGSQRGRRSFCFGDFVALEESSSPSNSTMTRLRS